MVVPKRRVFIDVTPLRQSRDLRVLLGGQLVSLLGTQLTVVAVPYQVYRLTHSSDGELVHERIRDHRTRVLSDCLECLPPETAAILLAAVPAMEALAEAVKSLSQ